MLRLLNQSWDESLGTKIPNIKDKEGGTTRSRGMMLRSHPEDRKRKFQK